MQDVLASVIAFVVVVAVGLALRGYAAPHLARWADEREEAKRCKREH
jgi:hypothetical protein